MSVESEILAATNQVGRRPTEDEQDYLKRISQATFDLSPTVWNRMSEQARRWSYDSVVAQDGNGVLPPMPVTPKSKFGEAHIEMLQEAIQQALDRVAIEFLTSSDRFRNLDLNFDVGVGITSGERSVTFKVEATTP